jgi:hypothetical protein
MGMRNHSQRFSAAHDNNRSGSTRRWVGVLALAITLLGGLSGAGSIQAATANQPDEYSATLTWDNHPNVAVTGYRVYHGTTSRNYFETTDVGNTTTHTVSGLTAGTTHYFAISAYNVLGAESPLSAEIIIFQPKPVLAVQFNAARQPVLTVTGLVGHSYEVQATQDFKTWTPLSIVTMGTNGTLAVTDPAAAGLSHRFYRTLEVLP